MGKADRIIQIYFKLISEHSAMKRQLEKEFETDRRSIERDINEVKDMLSSRGYIIRHERTEDGVRYKLAIADQTRADTGFLSEPQLLMIIGILASSRMLQEKEARDLIKSLEKVAQVDLLSKEQKNIIRQAENSSLEHYKAIESSLSLSDDSPLGGKDSTFDVLYQLYQAVYFSKDRFKIIRISYVHNSGKEEDIRVMPFSIVFDNHYLYMRAVSCDTGRPWNYRVDRIIHVEQTGENPDSSIKKSDYTSRPVAKMMFEEENPVTIRFRCHHPAVSAALDEFSDCCTEYRLHDADGNQVSTIEETRPGGYVDMTIRNYSKGCMFWFLSQGDKVEVLTESVRRDIREKLKEALKRYE